MRLAHHLRALAVSLHLVAITLVAIPSVGSGMNRSAWATPTVQAEFRAWSSRLGALGVSITPDDLERRAWDFAQGYEAARARVLAPFDPYYTYAGTWQTWKMFVAPHLFEGRLMIEVDRGRGWERLYLARDAEADWHRAWFDHDRMRAAVFRYSWAHYRTPRSQMVDWIAKTVAAEEPDARRIRVSFLRARTRTPQEVLDGVVVNPQLDLPLLRDLAGLR